MFVDRAAVVVFFTLQISISLWEVGRSFPGVQNDCFLSDLLKDLFWCLTNASGPLNVPPLQEPEST